MRRKLRLAYCAVLAGLSGIAASSVRAQLAVPETRVLVLPFVGASEGSSAWIGGAVQQDLLTDLTQGTMARVIAPSEMKPVMDADGALRTAAGAGASIVVFGQAQSSAGEVRLTGQVMDVASGHALGAIKATGPSDQLFHLEDALAGQIFAALPRTLLTAQTMQGLQQAQQTTNQPAPQPAPEPEQTPAPLEAPVQPLPTNPVAQPPYTDGTEVVSVPVNPYPQYSYEYDEAPVYSYAPAYTYVAPGCDVWPDVRVDVGGYGYFHDYGRYDGIRYRHYDEHRSGYAYHREPEHRDYATFAGRGESGRFGGRSAPEHARIGAGERGRSAYSSGSTGGSPHHSGGYGSGHSSDAASHGVTHSFSGGSSHSSGGNASHGGGGRR